MTQESIVQLIFFFYISVGRRRLRKLAKLTLSERVKNEKDKALPRLSAVTGIGIEEDATEGRESRPSGYGPRSLLDNCEYIMG